MERFFILDKYNTYYDWDLILTAKEITPPEPKVNRVEIDGMSGSIDLSEALTGEITYKDRVISATFWTSTGTRQDRERLLRDITIALHGKKIKVIEPDDSTHYFVGRVTIKSVKNILPYMEFSITIDCEPWRYAIEDTVRTVSISSSTPIDIVFNNKGAKTVYPTVIIDGALSAIINGIQYTFSSGSYPPTPEFKFKPGVNITSVWGEGTATVVYKEADL